LNDQINSLLAYIATKPYVPKHFAIMIASLVWIPNTLIFILILVMMYTC